MSDECPSRRFRFGLRTLFVLVTVASVCMACAVALAVEVRQFLLLLACGSIGLALGIPFNRKAEGMIAAVTIFLLFATAISLGVPMPDLVDQSIQFVL